jgi:tetratricopeptide (TPR) repeat protein
VIERALCPTLIGREEELSSLEDALLDIELGEGRVVVLSGEAGLGKTRLATELRRQAVKLGCTVLWGSCSEADLAVPYLPLLEAVGNYLSQVDLASLCARLGPTARALARLFPQLGAEADSGGGDDPTQAKLRFFEAVLSLLGLLASEHPLVLVVEDLHWADPSTHELVDYLARRVLASPILLLITYRLEEVDGRHPVHPTLQGWHRARLAQTVTLSSLQPDQVAGMVSAIFDEPQVGAEFRDYLHRRSEGNPFVLEEMLKEALDTGDIFRSDKGWDRRAIVDLHIPKTVRETILTRMERLETAQRRALRIAAVIGSSFDFDMLAELSEVEFQELDEIVRECVRQQFVEEVEDGDGPFRFRHSLTWEAIYSDISAPQRIRLHDQVARLLEERGAAAGDRARHLASAHRITEAVPLWLEAAEEALHRRAYIDAAELYERALPHIEDDLVRERIRGALGNALFAAGSPHLPAAIRHLEGAIGALESSGAIREAAVHRMVLGRCYWLVGRWRAARAEYDAARRALEPFGPSEDLANAYLRLGGQDAIDCSWSSAVQLLDKAIDIATKAGADAPRIGAYLMLAAPVLESGDIEGGMALYDRAVAEAMERDLDLLASNALCNSIVARLDLARARDCLPLIDRLRRLPHNRFSVRALTLQGAVCLYLGRLDEAIGPLRDGLRSTAPDEQDHRESRKWLARVLSELGSAEEAVSHAVRPDEDRGPQDVVFETIAWARLHLAQGTPEATVPAVDQVLERFDGLPPWRLHGPPELADVVVAVLVATGDVNRAAAVASEVETRGLTWSPWGKRARARALLAAGEPRAARSLLVSALREFVDADYRLEEIETRLLLARALRIEEDRRGALREVQSALARATDCQARRLAGAARGLLAELGGRDGLESPATKGDDGYPNRVAQRASVFVLAGSRAGVDAPIARLQLWARRAVERRGGVAVDSDRAVITARFDAEIDAGDLCADAVRCAVALHRKGALLDVPIDVDVSLGDVGDRSAIEAATATGLIRDTILLSDGVYRALQPRLDAQPWPFTVQPLQVTASKHAPVYTIRRGHADRSQAAPKATADNVFRCDGEYWTVAYRGTVVRLKDSKGLHDVATLLASPGREIAAVDLASRGSVATFRDAHDVADGRMTLQGDVGPALDEEARRQYRDRLVDVEEEINSAEAAHDPERASRMREEREFLLAELGAAVGIGGRERRMLDPAERARKTVTWRIRDSIGRLTNADKAIGDHFRRSVRTGMFCVYDPPEPTAWSL